MKTINIFTYDYPAHGNDSYFIEDELLMISSLFDKINVIPLKFNKKKKKNYINKDNINYDFSLSGRVYKLKNIIHIFFRLFVCKIFWKEIFKMHKKNSLKRTIMTIKERILAENLFLWVVEKQIDKASNIFYSYWSNHTLLSFYLLKKKRIIDLTFARTHGNDLKGFIPYDDFVSFKEYKFQLLNILLVLNEGQINKLKEEKLISQKKVIKCYMGIEPQEILIDNNKSKKIHFVSCGSLIHIKNTIQILKFIELTSNNLNNYEISYTCIGKGKDEDKIYNYANSNFKKVNFKMINNVDNLVTFFKMNSVDFFINLSFSEGMSFAVMEAMSCSIPAICSKIPGNTEIVNNNNGYILESNSQKDMIILINNIKNDLEKNNIIKKKIIIKQTIENQINRSISLNRMKNIVNDTFLK